MFLYIFKKIFWLNYYLFFNSTFITLYVLGNAFLSLIIYHHAMKFYNPIIDKETKRDLHDDYPEFKKSDGDKITYLRVFLGLLFLVWWKLISLISIASLVMITMKYYVCLNIQISTR